MHHYEFIIKLEERRKKTDLIKPYKLLRLSVTCDLLNTLNVV